MVPGVNALGAVLHLNLFPDHKALDQREIPACLAIATDAAEAERRYADVARERLRRVAIESGVHIEPVVRAALILRQDHVVRIAAEQSPHVAESERRPALALHHSVQLPSAQDEVERPCHVGAEPLSSAEG